MSSPKSSFRIKNIISKIGHLGKQYNALDYQDYHADRRMSGVSAFCHKTMLWVHQPHDGDHAVPGHAQSHRPCLAASIAMIMGNKYVANGSVVKMLDMVCAVCYNVIVGNENVGSDAGAEQEEPWKSW